MDYIITPFPLKIPMIILLTFSILAAIIHKKERLTYIMVDALFSFLSNIAIVIMLSLKIMGL
ncbi:MAG TPA: hypothetical protein VI911_10695 [Patescibacteria group bacterium]|nr:hypothetical protein [Patescibacteria group bacterium]